VFDLVRHDPVDEGVTLRAVLGAGQPVAHPRIAVDGEDGVAVAVLERPQDEAAGFDQAGRPWVSAP
jgi:hypothetical protein